MTMCHSMFFRATLISAAIATAAIGPASPANSQPPGDCYIAISGDCVPYPEPGTRPPCATALCRDGDWSCSEHPHASGTCHGHGVAQYV
jgi:hypothetical protein